MKGGGHSPRSSPAANPWLRRMDPPFPPLSASTTANLTLGPTIRSPHQHTRPSGPPGPSPGRPQRPVRRAQASTRVRTFRALLVSRELSPRRPGPNKGPAIPTLQVTDQPRTRALRPVRWRVQVEGKLSRPVRRKVSLTLITNSSAAHHTPFLPHPRPPTPL